MAPTYVPILRQPFWHRRYVAWMQRSEIQESATWLSVPPYFAALHTGYV